MKEYKIYLAGGMQDLSFKEQNEWREYIKNTLKERYYDGSLKYALDIINPCDYYNFEQGEKYDTYSEVMRFDLHQVKTSDLLIVNLNSKNSIGTAMEMATAYNCSIPIISFTAFEVNELHPWFICTSEKILKSADDTVNYVSDYYLK